MIRKSVQRFSVATNAERVCAEIMRKQKAKTGLLPGKHRLLEIGDTGVAPGQHLAELIDHRRRRRMDQPLVPVKTDHAARAS